MFCKIGVYCILPILVAYAATFEDYESQPTDLEEDIYSFGNGAYPIYPYMSDIRDDPAKNLWLYKLFGSLEPGAHSRPHYMSEFNDPNNPQPPSFFQLHNDLELKEPMVKRPSDAIGSAPTIGYKVKPVVSKQPKWNKKKGKTVGSHIICYFKLCSFRLLGAV